MRTKRHQLVVARSVAFPQLVVVEVPAREEVFTREEGEGMEEQKKRNWSHGGQGGDGWPKRELGLEGTRDGQEVQDSDRKKQRSNLRGCGGSVGQLHLESAIWAVVERVRKESAECRGLFLLWLFFNEQKFEEPKEGREVNDFGEKLE
nr:hypothetical protein Iba_chr10eCG5640 [Ipomoea batatas]